MRICTFREFAELPEGTIYSYYGPAYCYGLWRKGETIDNGKEPIDFFEASLIAQCPNGDDPVVDDIEGRWGDFDYHQLFAVYDEKDIISITKMLTM